MRPAGPPDQPGRIVVLTGAGLSAESGIPTFRDGDGLWERHRIEDVATPEAFDRDPALVLRFYDMRRAAAATARPNPAHAALARLSHHPGVTLITQNIDTLLDRAGARDVIHMHGRIDSALCAACGHRWTAPAAMATSDPCPACGRPATRPDIVWFGEMPYHMDRIEQALAGAQLFAAIGTSGQVYPAAGFVDLARSVGARTVELNLVPTDDARDRFDDSIAGPAGETVPAWVDGLIGPA
ncbi:NAD-dependent deacylase [Paracoccus luteus]|uniref:NAD-dependent deacylase n=1 Tax=Paracoccus luteus TaxID=2508543 RepID=UPI00106F5729|nr:NAD-dependent deacylase [Paracoccus luteus]